MMKNSLMLTFIFCVAQNLLLAQIGGFAFGIKGGATLGLQKWQGQTRESSFSWNGSAFLESAGEDNTFLYYTELGIHNKGSAIVLQRYYDPVHNVEHARQRRQHLFQNLSLLLGGKSRFSLGKSLKAHYTLALRGDYNLAEKGNLYSFNDDYVNKFTYGITVGVGAEYPLGKNIGLVLDLHLSPDFSRQILIPPGNYRDPVTNQLYTLPETRVTNTALELTLGFRFDRSWETE